MNGSLIHILFIRYVDWLTNTKWIIDQLIIWIIDPLVKGVKQCQNIDMGMLWARPRR